MELWGDKSPGPDGFKFLFFKKCWTFIKEDFVNFLNSFYSGSVISKAVISSFLTLMLKNLNTLNLDYYRPICLVGYMYKVVAKILAERVKKVLFKIISSCQNAFVPGRQFLDGVLVDNEVVIYATKVGKYCVLFKVDLEKAYDKVSWNFLCYMMKRMGFGRRWLAWMELLVINSNMYVIFNGSPTK